MELLQNHLSLKEKEEEICAEDGIARMKRNVDALIVVENNNLLKAVPKGTTMEKLLVKLMEF